MKKVCLLLTLYLLFFNAGAAISWMGNHSTGTQPNNSQTIHFYVEMYDSYDGCHAAVMIKEGGTWTEYVMTQGSNSGNNSTWSVDINVKSNSTEYYFHGWDNWGANVYDNNNSSNYSIVINPTTAKNGDWFTDATWCDGATPTSEAANFVIAHDVTLNGDKTIGGITVISGATFTVSDETSPTLTIAASGSITNNGTFNAGTGTVSFAGSGTVSGTVGFNNVSIAGGVNFGASSTVSGVLQINAGGYVITNAPTYLTGSILRYNTGTDYDISGEWYANQTTGAGIPYNVDINSSTQVHFSGSQKHTMNGSFTIASGKTFSLSSVYGADFYIKGDFINNGGTFNSNSRLVTFNGTANQEFKGAGSTSFSYLTIDNSEGITLNGSGLITVANDLTINSGKKLTINPGKSLTVSGTLTNNAGSSGLVIKSDATGTGSLITSNAVNATVGRYLTNYTSLSDKKYHFISSPVDAQPIRPSFVANTPLAAVDFYKYNEPSNLWINTKQGTDPDFIWNSEFEDNFVVGRGYMVAYPTSPVTKEFSGELNASEEVLTCTNTPDNGNGWNLIGNPFPSAIDWDLVTLGDGMDNALYYYDASIENYLYYINIDGITVGSGSQYIPAMQGFMVHAKSSGAKTITIDNGDRVHQAQNVFYKTSATIPGSMSLKVTAGDYKDVAFVHFNNGATTLFDGAYDAYKLFSYNETVPQIYTMSSDDKKLAINGLPELTNATEVLVSFKAGVDGAQSLTADVSQLATNAVLHDLKTGELTDLHLNPVYQFTASTTDSPSRFKLTFSGVGLDSPVTTDPQTIFTYGNQLFIQNPGTALVEIYTFAGQLVARQNVNESGLWSQPLHLSAGQYVVRVVNGSFAKTAKVVLF